MTLVNECCFDKPAAMGGGCAQRWSHRSAALPPHLGRGAKQPQLAMAVSSADEFHGSAQVSISVPGKGGCYFLLGPGVQNAAKIWRGLPRKCAAMAAMKGCPNSVCFFSPTPLIRENSKSVCG